MDKINKNAHWTNIIKRILRKFPRIKEELPAELKAFLIYAFENLSLITITEEINKEMKIIKNDKKVGNK